MSFPLGSLQVEGGLDHGKTQGRMAAASGKGGRRQLMLVGGLVACLFQLLALLT